MGKSESSFFGLIHIMSLKYKYLNLNYPKVHYTIQNWVPIVLSYLIHGLLMLY